MSGASKPPAEAPPLTQAHIAAALEAIPYARFLGLRPELRGDELTLVLPYKDDLIGNPMLPALHGGVVGALMELTAVAQLSVLSRQAKLPKTIDIGIDYLRSGRPVDTFARAEVTKLGRRIANVTVTAWQYARSEPIAAMHGHFLVTPAEG